MKAWELMDIEETWDVILSSYQLGKDGGLMNELDIYRKWIPRFNKKLQRLLTNHSSGRETVHTNYHDNDFLNLCEPVEHD